MNMGERSSAKATDPTLHTLVNGDNTLAGGMSKCQINGSPLQRKKAGQPLAISIKPLFINMAAYQLSHPAARPYVHIFDSLSSGLRGFETEFYII